MRRRLAPLCPIVLALLSTPLAPARAEDSNGTEATARAILEGLEQEEFQRVYRDHLAERAQKQQSEEVFILRYSQGMKNLKSKGSDRTLLGEEPKTELPDNKTGKTVQGDFVWLRFKTEYAAGPVLEDVYLERVGDEWRAVGIFMSPAN